jgi:hypothetical protein
MSSNAKDAAKTRKRTLEEAMKPVHAFDVDPVIETFAAIGESYIDLIDHVAEYISRKAEDLVLRKFIEQILASDEKSSVRVLRCSHGCAVGEATNDVATIIANLRSLPEHAVLECYFPGNSPAHALVVWGNEPSEVISDYDERLKPYVKSALEFAESLEGKPREYSQSYAWRKVRIDRKGDINWKRV